MLSQGGWASEDGPPLPSPRPGPPHPRPGLPATPLRLEMSALLQQLCPTAEGALLGAGEEGGLRAERGTGRLAPLHAHTCRGGRSWALRRLQGEAWWVLVAGHVVQPPGPPDAGRTQPLELGWVLWEDLGREGSCENEEPQAARQGSPGTDWDALEPSERVQARPPARPLWSPRPGVSSSASVSGAPGAAFPGASHVPWRRLPSGGGAPPPPRCWAGEGGVLAFRGPVCPEGRAASALDKPALEQARGASPGPGFGVHTTVAGGRLQTSAICVLAQLGQLLGRAGLWRGETR